LQRYCPAGQLEGASFNCTVYLSERVYCTETRPYNQGARLTAYELVHDEIPATLICDDMVAATLKKKQITAVIVGADRVAANGDTANKIGTYQVHSRVSRIERRMITIVHH